MFPVNTPPDYWNSSDGTTQSFSNPHLDGLETNYGKKLTIRPGQQLYYRRYSVAANGVVRAVCVVP